ncbi:MAG: putative glycolipid-binding domain-containing protein [Chryseobacterium sp.]|uniref:putative glycolipid-binding domain-containing protein n=1 Tax=Chryseobacterium sp. TaxID=1871047 RepID=UPI0025BD685F|nr:putative glycolipid-binding domain-containing protein [Chryseobacterium sp.]MCJ7932899.1 putative glycolipid-binding domain-containing protein [Chryseobacterium sp.]
MKTLIWQGILYQSLEYFKIKENGDRYTIESKIIGCYENKMYTADYKILITQDWTVLEFVIESEINTIKNILTGKKRQDEWVINNVIHPDFKGFEYIDISLTPFTNTLPINNLKLAENSSRKIDVIYIDVLNHHIRPAKQQYTRTALNKYLYENIETDFKAEISVDEAGLVISYPKLFEKTSEFLQNL